MTVSLSSYELHAAERSLNRPRICVRCLLCVVSKVCVLVVVIYHVGIIDLYGLMYSTQANNQIKFLTVEVMTSMFCVVND